MLHRRGRAVAIAVFVTVLISVAGTSALASNRIFRCIGEDGELVFRDQPCSRAGLADVRARRPTMFQVPRQNGAEQARCLFASKPLLLVDPAFEQTKLRLIVDIDAEGPYLNIVSGGTCLVAATVIENPELGESVADAMAGDALPIDSRPGDQHVVIASREVPATFDARVPSQGLLMGDGTFYEAEWRMGERTLGFGRSRMPKLLTALSREEASLVVWFQGMAQPVQSSSIPAEEFRLAVDNVRRCWRTLAPNPK